MIKKMKTWASAGSSGFMARELPLLPKIAAESAVVEHRSIGDGDRIEVMVSGGRETAIRASKGRA